MPTSHPSVSQPEVNGLRNDGQWNPLLPSSPEEEQLTAIPSTHTNHRSTNHANTDPQQDFSADNPNFDNFGFSNAYLEDELQLFGERHMFRTGTGMTQEEPQSATSLTSRSHRTVSRKSTGLANMSSQLMSPVLTDIASPESTFGDSPIIHHKVLGGGVAEDMSSIDTHGNSSHTYDNSAASKASTNTSMKSQMQSGGTVSQKTQNNRKRRGSEPDMQELDDEYVIVEDNPTVSVVRHGIDPSSRTAIADTEVETLTEQTNKRAVKAKNADISRWLSRNELSAADHAHLTGFTPGVTTRRRSRSTGDAIILPPHILPQAPIAEEHSEDEGNDSDFGSYHEEAPASFATKPEPKPRVTFDEPEEPPKPTDAFPWVDPIRFPSEHGSVGQPGTANEAMMKFLTKSRDIETASRAATWGTQRRMSDGDHAWTHSDHDMQRIFGHGGLFSRLSLTREKEKEEWRHFKEHAKEKAAKWWSKRESLPRPAEPIRSPSKDSFTSPAASIKTASIKSKRESTHDLTESIKAKLHRHSYSKKPKSPDPESHGHESVERSSSPSDMYSMGHNHSLTGLAHAISGRLSRHGSKDDGHHLATLWKTKSGGPPVAYPKLTQSPPNKLDSQFRSPPITNSILSGAPVAEPSTIQTAHLQTAPINTAFALDRQLPIPTLEGFRIDASRRLPHLPPFLVDRLALEQLRRYKKLVEFKAKHAKLVATNSCPSGIHCIAGEGHVTTFPAKAQKDSVGSQLGVNMSGDADEDDEALDEGLLTENSFPPGMPATPAKRLPAQFECPLCFQVKKFTKPSDWSKHVHEDLQPFTCTFIECPEPKSFKRKADWVRHENERHRHLEWWQCTEEGCTHQCFRRDNFVQHLCREHKMPEPKAKTIKPDNKPAVRGPAKTKGKGNIEYTPETKVLWMVENCRHETSNRAIDEPCRLCGRAFSTWKKLTVDLAKHMEELSLPVLELVNQKVVNTETVVSPIDVKPSQFKTEQSPYISSSNVSPFDPPMTIGGISDLPGAFAPLPVSTTFQQPHFGSVSWNSTQNQNGQAVFPGQINAWPSGDVHYGSQNNAMFNGGNSSAFGHVQQQPGHNDFNQMSSAMLTQGLNMPYQDTSGLLADMNVSPSYTGTNFGDLSSQATHHSPPIGYASGELQGGYMHHDGHHNNPALYTGQPDQMHLQQGQANAHLHHNQQQQQHQQQQQPPSQQFYQPSY